MPIERLCGCRTCKEETQKAVELVEKLTTGQCPMSAFVQTAMANVILHDVLLRANQAKYRSRSGGLLGSIVISAEMNALEDKVEQVVNEQITNDVLERMFAVVTQNSIDLHLERGDLDTTKADELLRNIKKPN